MTKHHRILSVNGGGVRGLVPAKIIEEIIKKAQKPIHELFDYVVGTSAGGLIAISLTVKDENGNPKYSATDVVNIFKDDAQKIFPPSYLDNMPALGKIMQLFTAKYSREGIDTLLESKLGNATFLNTTIPITTVSYSLDYDGPRLWSTYRAENSPYTHNYLLKDAAGATSAAPTFFPMKTTVSPAGKIFHDIDGGIFANSPTMIGITEFLKSNMLAKFKELTVVSIGTGRFIDEPFYGQHVSNEDISYFGTISGIGSAIPILGTSVYYAHPIIGGVLAFTIAVSGILYDAYNGEGGIGLLTKKSLIDRMMKGTELSDAFQSKVAKVMRINPQLDKKYKSMDDSSTKHIQEFEQEIDIFIKKNSLTLDKVAGCLISDNTDSDVCQDARSYTAHFDEDMHTKQEALWLHE